MFCYKFLRVLNKCFFMALDNIVLHDADIFDSSLKIFFANFPTGLVFCYLRSKPSYPHCRQKLFYRNSLCAINCVARNFKKGRVNRKNHQKSQVCFSHLTTFDLFTKRRCQKGGIAQYLPLNTLLRATKLRHALIM